MRVSGYENKVWHMRTHKYVTARAIDVLESAGIVWHFISGGVLQVVRNNGWEDKDIDIGIWCDWSREKVGELFLRAGFIYNHGFGHLTCGMQDTYTMDDIDVDVHRMYVLGNKMWHCAWDNAVNPGGECDMVSYMFTRVGRELRNGVWVPAETERYLDEHYGDWRVVHEGVWHYAKSAPNAVYTGARCRQVLSHKDEGGPVNV